MIIAVHQVMKVKHRLEKKIQSKKPKRRTIRSQMNRKKIRRNNQLSHNKNKRWRKINKNRVLIKSKYKIKRNKPKKINKRKMKDPCSNLMMGHKIQKEKNNKPQPRSRGPQ